MPPQELTKDTILALLKDRFKKEIVYTYVGDIVVSVNPFKNVGAVGKSIRNRYKKGGAQNAQLLMPHCCALAAGCLQCRVMPHAACRMPCPSTSRWRVARPYLCG